MDRRTDPVANPSPPSYFTIVTAAATTFAAMLVGRGALWLGCDLVEYELTGFDRPSAKATLAFYVLWAGFLIVPAAYLTAAFSFGS